MAEEVQDLRCFIGAPVPLERYYIYDALLQILAALGGGADCLSIQGCETQAFPVQISAASLPLPTGAATEATFAKLPLAQGSTTASESGVLIQGAVTTAAPSYTTAQTSPLSLTTTGALRVAISGSAGAAQTISRSVASTGGSVTAGATSITLLSSSDFIGTVAGATFSASIAENFTAQPGSTLAALAYTISAGNIAISKIV